MTFHQLVARKGGPVHAIAFQDGLYLIRARCGILRKPLMQIKKRKFRSVPPDQRCVRCNGSV